MKGRKKRLIDCFKIKIQLSIDSTRAICGNFYFNKISRNQIGYLY